MIVSGREDTEGLADGIVLCLEKQDGYGVVKHQFLDGNGCHIILLLTT